MVTAAVLTADQRLAYQIQTWMKDLGDTVKLETHLEFDAFVKKIETENVADLMAAAEKKKDNAIIDAEDIGSGKSKVFEPYYRLLIVDLDLLQARDLDPVEWSKTFKKLLADQGRSDSLFPTSILFMAFDGGDFRVDDLRSPVIDDLIFKPLDRSVFLQKVELLVADNVARLKPTFLFRQKVELPIEIGKDAIADEISEFAIAIRNPAPIKPGIYASIHSTLFGDGELSRIVGRAYYSEPHPHLEGQHLVYFGFFGLRADQLSKVRKFVRDRQIPPKFRVPQNQVPAIDPAIPFTRAAVIDMDEAVFHELSSALKDHYVGVDVQHYFSYARFMATLIKLFQGPTTPPAAAAASATAPQVDLSQLKEGKRPWTMAGSLIFTVDGDEKILKAFESVSGPNDQIFGKHKQEWIMRPQTWLEELSEHDRSELDEMYAFTLSGGKGRALLRLIDAQKNAYYLEALSTLNASKEPGVTPTIRVELKEMEPAVWKASNTHLSDEAMQVNPADFRFDALFIDANLIRSDDLQAWIDGLHEIFLKAGVFVRGEKFPRIIVMAHEKSSIRPEAYRLKGIADFLFKPLDRKMVSYKVKTVVDEFIARGEPDVPHFVTQSLDVKLAKDAQMLEVSEYGLSISHPTPFKNGTMIRFFSSQIGGGADGVIGRSSHCDKTNDKVPSYVCHFTFFGVTDEVLKKIRTWIREDYVQSKSAR